MTNAKIRYYQNPRNEDNQNDLSFVKEGLVNLGLESITLDDGLLEEVIEIAERYKARVDHSKIICTSTWTKDINADYEGSSKPVY